MASTKLKASERQAIIQKLVGVLKKKYGKPAAEAERTVLQTLIFAACLEDASPKAAEAAVKTLLESFYDLNEIRVSAISEIEEALSRLPGADWRALRIRDVLQTVFETHYAFDMEGLRRKTHELAAKDLLKIRFATPFMRMYVMQQCLGGHVLPLDAATLSVLVWLGLVEPDGTSEQAAEDLKSSVRKPDTALVCHLLRCLATDAKYEGQFKLTRQEREQGIDPETAPQRLADLLAGRRKAASPSKKTAVVKTHKKPTPKETPRRPKAGADGKAVKKKLAKKPAKR
jgi:endonuclease III